METEEYSRPIKWYAATSVLDDIHSFALNSQAARYFKVSFTFMNQDFEGVIFLSKYGCK